MSFLNRDLPLVGIKTHSKEEVSLKSLFESHISNRNQHVKINQNNKYTANVFPIRSVGNPRVARVARGTL